MKKITVALLAFLLLIPSLHAQKKVPVASQYKAATPVYQEMTLDIGDHAVFDFNTTEPGVKPFGGKPYRTEFESRDNDEITTAWRGKIEVEVNGVIQLADQAIIFAGKDSPENITLRVIVDNATVYRCNIKINKVAPKPVPSVYLEVVLAGYKADKALPSDAKAHAEVFRRISATINSYKYGSDVWKAVEVAYANIKNLVQTRSAIAKILFDETRQYYDTQLSSSDRRELKRVLADIQLALEQCNTQPDPTPPDPKPVPTSGKVWLVVIEETSQAANNRGAFFDNKPLKDHIVSKGHKYRVEDKDVKDENGNTPPDLAPYINATKGVLPHLFVVDQVTGKVLFDGKLPDTPALLLELLGKVGV